MYDFDVHAYKWSNLRGVHSGQSKAVALLIQNGADACARDERGNTESMGH
ncbi:MULTISPECIES: hypothetical protein [Vibrio]|nr:MULTISPECIES: hypothetical protein [Vibrio]ELB2282864.1 hypothetical protein [Vibrio alginolyticus]MCR9381247.1 hypothetical protein [Vibrio alginolyticus]MCR9431721.1 hypothetical protein [Vibrio alginolyticus]MCR9436427.1 hypothetical protein [Vibrio alginolyticus]MCS0197282.1 hypothetical protein [Vibrio alginolyticus]